MGAADSKTTFAKAVKDQVLSIAAMVAKVTTLIASADTAAAAQQAAVIGADIAKAIDVVLDPKSMLVPPELEPTYSTLQKVDKAAMGMDDAII